MKRRTKCRIVDVGKRRDGGTRFWCLAHHADATAKYGVQAEKCRYAEIPALKTSDILELDIADYPGGVALWGAVPPVYDTTTLPLDRGIHIHTRKHAKQKKVTDSTYRSVKLIDGKRPKLSAAISELDAIYYMISSIFGFKMKHVTCGHCGFAHLDKDWFSLHPHKCHLCAGCGQYFRDTEPGIGNPIIGVQELFNNHPGPAIKTGRTKEIKQSDFPGGIQIWGSNLSVFWTGSEKEEEGLHIHAYEKGTRKPALDDTYSRLIIDGIRLDPFMVRVMMAQSALPHIEGRIVSIKCPKCERSHFSSGVYAFTASAMHSCKTCGSKFPSKGRLRNIIANPLVDVLSSLEQKAPRASQGHKANLLPETL